MTTYKFLYLTSFLADAIGVLGILSKSLQRHDLQYTSAMTYIKASVSALEALLINDGPCVKKLKACIPNVCTPPDFQYKGHDFKDSEKERKTAEETCSLFISEVCARLRGTFPDSGIMHAFSILDPGAYPEENDDLYGDELLKEIIVHFELSEQDQDDTLEWNIAKQLVKAHKGSGMVFSKFYERILFPARESYPHLVKMATIALTITPTSSVPLVHTTRSKHLPVLPCLLSRWRH